MRGEVAEMHRAAPKPGLCYTVQQREFDDSKPWWQLRN